MGQCKVQRKQHIEEIDILCQFQLNKGKIAARNHKRDLTGKWKKNRCEKALKLF